MLELSHKNLDVWKKSMNFTSKIYEMSSNFPQSEKYGLQNQLRRAAISIPSNIAEGASRKSKVEKSRFYEIARSSLVEIDTQLELTRRLKYIDENKLESLHDPINHIFAMLSQLIKNTRS